MVAQSFSYTLRPLMTLTSDRLALYRWAEAHDWQRLRISTCDVCEWETGEDDVRARTKCVACKKDVCDIHYQTYKTTVDLPHGGSKEVSVADYCDACYRHFVTEPKRQATRQARMSAR